MNPIGQSDMKTYEGNLLEHFTGRARPEVSAIAHVCNCQGVMGSGIAKAIRTRYPEAYQAYKSFEKNSSKGLSLGSVSTAVIDSDKHIYNLHAQQFYGTDGRRYLNYEALYASLENVCDSMCFSGLKTLGVPYKMGSDRAGGDWNVVAAMLSSIFEQHNIEVIAIKL